jgi:hypothetical protein
VELVSFFAKYIRVLMMSLTGSVYVTMLVAH